MAAVSTPSSRVARAAKDSRFASVGLNTRRTSLAYGGGLGVDYHTLSRHFAFGVHAGLQHIVGLAQSNALTTTAGVRYTF